MITRQPTSASAFALAMGFALGAGLASSPAQAAGGVFVVGTEAAPSVTTTDATAVFVVEGGRTQMHLRLELDLSASNQAGESLPIAWVVPLPAGSTFGQSSERLFANLAAATVPTWRTEVRANQCPSDEDDVLEDPFADPDPDATPPLPQGVIASYEPILAPATSIDALRATLEGLGYAILPGTESTLAPYVGPDRMVAIATFDARRGRNVLHPVAFDLGASAPELALRLTDTNAGLDANLQVYVLADERHVPSGWVHVVVNPIQVDWLGLGDNWQDAAGLAIAEDEANGQAFVTESFDSADAVSRAGLVDSRWNEARFNTLAASQVATELVQQGLYSCYGAPNGCQPRHPLVDDLLEEFLLPPGITIAQYFDCPTCYVDALIWRPAEFAEALRARIIDPGRAVADRLGRIGSVTRMYSRLGNGSVVSDPSFVARPGDDAISASRLAGALRRCGGDLVLSLPDGREVVAPRGGPWPEFVEEMPFAERIEQLTATGDGIALVDNREAINTLLSEHNADYGWPPQSGCSSCRSTGGRGGPGTWLLLTLIGLGARRRRWAGALVLLSACAGRQGSAERPKPTEPDAIAAELDRNERALADLGISIEAPGGGGGDVSVMSTPQPEPPATVPDESPESPPEPGPPPEPEPEPVAATDDDDEYEVEDADASPIREKRAPTRCERICDLSEATCELADHVCHLAEGHTDDPRYAEACTRAQQQCRVADDACRACE